jgi:acetyl-CoA decarbonylase/synthase complex subunit gamma
MALKGLDIYKLLPRENCKECGLPTCLAFAMKVAGGQAGLEDCPRLSEEALAQLSDASAPPQRLVKIGPPGRGIQIGQETVLFRHEEKFHQPAAVAMQLVDTGEADALKAACADFKALEFPRVGEVLCPDMVALVNESGQTDKMVAAAQIVQDELGVPMVLISPSVETLQAVATGPLSDARPLLYCAGEVTPAELAELARAASAPLCVAGDIETVAGATEALAKAGVQDIVISPGPVDVAPGLTFLTRARRAALKKTFRPLGYPSLAIACGEDKDAAALDACAYMCKYAGIIVSDAWQPHLLVPILTTRQNIYTDPQKPVQVEAKVYEIGEVSPDSPLLVTTNFSLSYYSVEGEVEAARVPCRILAVDTEGTSVLTAWAADKFNPEEITAAITKAGLAETMSHKKVVIPGHVAVIASQLGEESGWDVKVGPKEASGIGPYLKNEWKPT